MDLEYLSRKEELILKVLWSRNEDISTQTIIEILKNDYNHDYARTTVVTFLQRMIEKGYVRTYRVGKFAYFHYLIDKKTYLQRIVDSWNGALSINEDLL